MILRGGDAVLGELAFLHLDLAAPANAAPAAHALDVDAERARRIEHRRAERKTPPPPGGHEEDERVFDRSVHLAYGFAHLLLKLRTRPRLASRPAAPATAALRCCGLLRSRARLRR